MNLRLSVVSLAAVLLFVGCTPPQAAVAFPTGKLNSSAGRVGVVMTAIPKVNTSFPGASCLLCIAAAEMANTTLTEYSHTLQIEDLPKLKVEVADLLRKNGVDTTVVEAAISIKDLPDAPVQGPNLARKDFSSFRSKFDRLVVIDISALGFQRTYASYIPTSDPKGYLSGVGYLVNLKTNELEWYETIFVAKATEGKWDEPPKFPGLTNAYFQAIELGKDQFKSPFSH